MKFSAGHPTLYDIRSHIHSEWKLDTPPAVGAIDQRHVTNYMGSSFDTKRALARPSNKIKTSFFKLFPWTADFEVGRESSFTAVWVKLHNLPLYYFNETALHRLGSLLGTVLKIHLSTINLTQQAYAKVCIEMDVSKPFLDTLWIGKSTKYGWTIELEYEGNHASCDYCGILGRTVGLCRKKREDHGKVKSSKGQDYIPTAQAKPNDKPGPSVKWVAKTVEAKSLKESQGMLLPKEVDKDIATQSTVVQGEDSQSKQVEILTRPHDAVNENTRQTLSKIGLIVDPETQSSPNNLI